MCYAQNLIGSPLGLPHVATTENWWIWAKNKNQLVPEITREVPTTSM